MRPRVRFPSSPHTYFPDIILRKEHFFLLLALVAALSCGRTDRSVETSLEEVAARFETAGLAVVAAENGVVKTSFYFGFANPIEKTPLTDETVFRVASLSKLVTALAVMKLVEQGKADLDKDIADYGFSVRNPAFPQQKITLRMLLSHTSTLKDGAPYDGFSRATIQSNGSNSMVDFLTSTADSMWANKAPGTWFAYSNFGFALAGTVLESISGERFDRFCRNTLFLPLELNASFNVSDFSDKTVIAGLVRKRDGIWIPQADFYPEGRPNPARFDSYVPGTNALVFGPQGSLRISAREMLVLVDLLRTKGKSGAIQLLPSGLIDEMMRPHWIFDGSNGENYGGLFNSWGLGVHIPTGNGKDQIVPGNVFYGHPGEAYGLLSDAYTDGTRSFVFITNGVGIPNKEGSRSAFYQIEEAVFDVLFNLPSE